LSVSSPPPPTPASKCKSKSTRLPVVEGKLQQLQDRCCQGKAHWTPESKLTFRWNVDYRRRSERGSHWHVTDPDILVDFVVTCVSDYQTVNICPPILVGCSEIHVRGSQPGARKHLSALWIKKCLPAVLNMVLSSSTSGNCEKNAPHR
jgi:hypothetical protein